MRRRNHSGSRTAAWYRPVSSAWAALWLAWTLGLTGPVRADDEFMVGEGANAPWRRTLLRWSSDAAEQGGPPDWDEPLASDRPDFTEASSTVGRGVRQLEMGYTYFGDDDGGHHLVSQSYPEMLLRVGVFADWLELRVAWSLASQTQALSGIGGTAHGSEDVYVGMKLGLTPQQGWLPEMALMPQMTVPVGGVFSAGRVLPGLNWLYGWDLSEQWSLGGSTQYNVSVDEFTDRVHGEFAQSLTVGRSLTESVSFYGEWFMLTPIGAETEGTEHYLDGGFTFRWSNDLQFDVRAGLGLSEASTNFFTGLGAVRRF